jgi:hypothetical protein
MCHMPAQAAALQSGDGFPDVLVVDYDSKLTSAVLCSFAKGMGSCLIVGSAYHNKTNTKVKCRERATSSGILSDTWCALL